MTVRGSIAAGTTSGRLRRWERGWFLQVCWCGIGVTFRWGCSSTVRWGGHPLFWRTRACRYWERGEDRWSSDNRSGHPLRWGSVCWRDVDLLKDILEDVDGLGEIREGG